jgi:hypothetical protein
VCLKYATIYKLLKFTFVVSLIFIDTQKTLLNDHLNRNNLSLFKLTTHFILHAHYVVKYSVLIKSHFLDHFSS